MSACGKFLSLWGGTSEAISESPAIAAVAADLERGTNLANAFAAGVPSAQVVRLPDADHYVFNSNEVQVIRAMNYFLDKLLQP